MFVIIHRPKIKSFKKRNIFAALFAALIVIATTATSVIAASYRYTTSVEYDGGTVTVSSFSSDPYAIVEKAGIELGSSDTIDLENFDIESEDNTISVKKAYEVLVASEDTDPVVYKMGGTVSDVLDAAGIELAESDVLNCSENAQITSEMAIIISKAVKVTVLADGKKHTYKVSDSTVGELLKSKNIKLSSDDIINHKQSEQLKDGMKIIIKRVKYEDKTMTDKIEYKTITKKSDELYIGQTKVKREGKNGERWGYYVCRYVDGKMQDRACIVTKVLKEPVDEVVLVGTKRYTNPVKSSRVISEIAPPYTIELDNNGRPLHYKKLITGKATAYYGGGITATGQKAMPGRIAVNPRQIPYGTKMYIVSSDGKYVYGYCVASDTGGFARRGTAIADLYFHSYSECVQFGRRSIEIYVLE